MTDYTKSTGSSGTMMIRVDSTKVYFYLKAASGSFNHDLSWGFTVNGVTDTRTVDFVGDGGYQLLGTWTVSTDQTVTFRIGDSGTSGIGGPTSFSVSVDRTSAPPTPPAWSLEQIEDVRIQGDVDGAPNGGLAIDQYQVRYDNNSDASSPLYFTPNSDGWGWVTGLTRGTTYYFWVRTHNAKGWSPWSARTSAKTKDLVPAPTSPSATEIGQSSITTVFHNNGDGGSPVLEWQLGYGVNPTSPQYSVSTNGTTTLNGLTPGTKYYFWARGRNEWGWGPYSKVSSATLLAGARINVNGVWKTAVPYVNVNGVWKPAQPWAKIGGLWKGTG